MDKEFVTYEQALALKELGYRSQCAAHYPFDEQLHLKWIHYGGHSTHPLNTLQAPTKSQVFRWFREKYEIYGIVGYYGKSQWSIEILNYKGNELLQIEDDFNTYEEAENACIDKLISICKQQDNGTSN